jgi:hypothetical protein
VGHAPIIKGLSGPVKLLERQVQARQRFDSAPSSPYT